MAELTYQAITKNFGRTEVLKGIDLEIGDGEFIVLLGPSGCGKSTLLRITAGLEDQTGGHVVIGGEVVDRISPARRGIAMVFQTYALYPHLDVAGNWALGLRQAGMARDEIDRRLADAARMLSLGDLMTRKPGELSGGQRQRVAIGRAIVRQPRVMLFDEPLSNLDAALRSQVRFEIGRLHKQLEPTIVYVTHDQIEAMTLADRIVVMHEGVVQQVGSPRELYRTPANLYVAGFIGSPSMNFFQGRADGSGRIGLSGLGEAGLGEAGLVGGGHAGPVVLGVRPDGFRIDTPQTGALRGRVVLSEYLGRETFLHVQLVNGEVITVEADSRDEIAIGSEIGLTPVDTACHLFDSASGKRIG